MRIESRSQICKCPLEAAAFTLTLAYRLVFFMHPVRIATGILSLAIAIFALIEHPFLGAPNGIGGYDIILLLGAAVLAACCFLSVKLNASLLMLAISSLFTFMAVEFGARMILSAKYYPPFEFHERHMFAPAAGVRGEFQHTPGNGGEVVNFRINKDGFRGEELLPQGQALRVAVYGDSFVEALFTPLEETFTERLEYYLSELLARPVEVVNAGVASYGPDQVIEKLREELPQLQPDLILLDVFGGNDFGDIIRNKMYRLDDNGRLLKNDYSLGANIKNSLEVNRRESIIKRIIRRLRKGLSASESSSLQSMSEEELVELFLQTNLDEFENYIEQGDDTVRNIWVDYYNADMSIYPERDSTIYKAQLMQETLGEINSIATKTNTPTAMFFIPHPMDVIGEHSSGRIDTNKFPDYVASNPTDVLAKSATVLNIPHVNLFDIFATSEPKNLYLVDKDDHWNSTGQDLAANATSKYLLAIGLVK